MIDFGYSVPAFKQKLEQWQVKVEKQKVTFFPNFNRLIGYNLKQNLNFKDNLRMLFRNTFTL